MFRGLENVQTNPRRGWTALVSFTLQAAAVAAALALPLMYPNSLPDSFAPRHIFVPISNPEISRSPANPHPESNGGTLSVPHSNPILVSNNLRFHATADGPDNRPADPPPWLPTGPNVSTLALGPPIGTVLPPRVPAAQSPPRISRSMQSYLIHRVEPRYPDIARTTRTEGAVLIKAVIGTEGKIEQAQVISGSPLLSRAALDAIRQWRYRPYLLNDKPIEVETEITVTFYLSR